MDKRYPYKTPVPWLCCAFVVLGLLTAGGCLLVRVPNGVHIHPRTALLVGLSTSGFAAVLTLTMRWLRPPFLTLRADGVYFPGRPREGWRVAFSDIDELRIVPLLFGCRSIHIAAQPLPLSNSDGWWSISERCLPNKEAFDEIYSHILSKLASSCCVSGEGAFCGFLQFASAIQALRTTVTVEEVARFPYQIVLDAFSDPAAQAAFTPSGNLFSIGEIKTGQRIAVDVNGHESVVVAPADRRHALVLDLQANGDVRTYFLDDEIRYTDAKDDSE